MATTAKPQDEAVQNEEVKAEAEVEAQGEAEAAAQSNTDRVLNTANAAKTTQRLVSTLKQNDVNIDHIDHIDTQPLEDRLGQIKDAATEQSQQKIDYAVDKGVNDLERAKEDAALQYQTQRDQVSADEQKALDNQALYAQARGDNGGIGEAQYAAIQAAAAQNRQTVNTAQTKLSTDTARQIADLRAQGEFQKADELLSITQSYLSQLMQLEQWALSTNLSVDEFNTQIDEWVAQFNRATQQMQIETELSSAQLTGAFSDGTTTAAAQQYLNEALAAAGSAAMSMGLAPTAEQVAAMGLTAEQWDEYKAGQGGGGGDYWDGGRTTIDILGEDGEYHTMPVKDLQIALNADENAGLDTDGIAGPLTEAALRKANYTFR